MQGYKDGTCVKGIQGIPDLRKTGRGSLQPGLPLLLLPAKRAAVPADQVAADVRRPAGELYRPADPDRPGDGNQFFLARRRTDDSRPGLFSPDRGASAKTPAGGQAHRQQHPDERRSLDGGVVPLFRCRAFCRRPEHRRAGGIARCLSHDQRQEGHPPAGDARLSPAAAAQDSGRPFMCGPCEKRPAPSRGLSLFQGDQGSVSELHSSR